MVSERDWWDRNLSIESELRKPRRSPWEFQHWEKIWAGILGAADLRGKRILDGGCGSGVFAENALTGLGPRLVVGLDLSKTALSIARERCKGLDGPVLVLGDLAQVPFVDGAFDLAIVVDSLHHVPNWHKALKELKRVAKALVLSEPNALNPIRRWTETRMKRLGVRETSFYPWELRRALETAGYKHVTLRYMHVIPRVAPPRWFALLERFESLVTKLPGVRLLCGSLFVHAVRR